MRHAVSRASVFLVVYGTSGGPALAEDQYVWLNERGAFAAAFVGPKIIDLDDPANFFVISDEGTIEGTWYGKELRGKWRWDEGYFCRTLSAPRPAAEDCQEWSLGDGKVRLLRSRGAGDSTVYLLGN